MKKGITIFATVIVLCFVAIHAVAQDENRRLSISGQVIDADLKEPMVQATIQLFTAQDSTFVGGTVSDNRGNFSIEAPSNGTYRL